MISDDDREKLKELVNSVKKIDPENDILWLENYKQRLKILTKNLENTMDYLNTCSEDEFDYISECFEELSKYFKSQDLINCVKSNISRFDNPELQKQLKMEIEYMKFYLNDKKK